MGLKSYVYRNRFIIALILVIWLFLIFVTGNKTYVYFLRNDLELNYELFIFRAFLIWTIAAAFVPVVLKMAEKFPLDTPRKGVNILIHLFGSALFVLFQSILFRAIMLLRYDPEGQWSEYFNSVLRNSMWIGLISPILYWCVVGAYHLKKSYNLYKEREVRLAELRSQLDRARLDLLKKQLRPHFLFNALHNINALIYEDIDAAEEMLRKLHALLYQSIQHLKFNEVRLEQELNIVSLYLEIEKVRFSDRLQIQIAVDEEAKRAFLPPLILQPLVENAIRHGISGKAGIGRIRLHARRVKSQLELIVEDDGVGFKQNGRSDVRVGIGIQNTMDRLHRLFQADYIFEMLESDTGGAKVRIRIPYTTETTNPHTQIESYEE